MKKAILLAATAAVVLGLSGCACHHSASQNSASNASAQDNSGYQSGYSSKLGSKKSH
jgi:hypothetical protein